MRSKFILFVLLGCFTYWGTAQEVLDSTDFDASKIIGKASKNDTRFDEATTLFRNEISGGVLAHTQGWGLNFRKAKQLTVDKKRFWNIDALTVKHPKEYKTFNQFGDGNKGYVFGKKFSVLNVRMALGMQNIIYQKESKKGVQISYVYMAGASIAFLKPVYLQVAVQGADRNNRFIEQRYNEDEHTQDEIRGRASVLRGLNELNVYPGGHAKFGLNFEYAPEQELLRAMEVGVALDYYGRKVPIMAFIDNTSYFFTFYLGWHFGKKSY